VSAARACGVWCVVCQRWCLSLTSYKIGFKHGGDEAAALIPSRAQGTDMAGEGAMIDKVPGTEDRKMLEAWKEDFGSSMGESTEYE
jgi:hypothetical protein